VESEVYLLESPASPGVSPAKAGLIDPKTIPLLKQTFSGDATTQTLATRYAFDLFGTFLQGNPCNC
jgi:hypothetical protein